MAQLGSGGIGETIDQLDSMDELNSFPELVLEFMKLKIIYHYVDGNLTTALKLLKSAFKKAIAGDLANYVIDFSVNGNGCSLMSDIPDKIQAKIEEYSERLRNNMDEDNTKYFIAYQKRRIEALRKFVSSVQTDKLIPKTISI